MNKKEKLPPKHDPYLNDPEDLPPKFDPELIDPIKETFKTLEEDIRCGEFAREYQRKIAEYGNIIKARKKDTTILKVMIGLNIGVFILGIVTFLYNLRK